MPEADIEAKPGDKVKLKRLRGITLTRPGYATRIVMFECEGGGVAIDLITERPNDEPHVTNLFLTRQTVDMLYAATSVANNPDCWDGLASAFVEKDHPNA